MLCGVALAGEHVDDADVERVADVLAEDNVSSHTDHVRRVVVRVEDSLRVRGRCTATCAACAGGEGALDSNAAA